MDYDKLIEHLRRRGLGNGSALGPHSGLNEDAADWAGDTYIKRDLREAADVVEVRRGRWYLAEDAVFRCSECGRICYELNAPYCYCGARMEKESEHETG